MGTLTGKTALITGGSEGIGLGIADAFAREGADLVLLARDPGKLDAVAARLHGASVRTVAVDLAEPDALAALPADLAVDIVVNNAGVTHLKSLEDTTDADFDAMVRVNLGVPFRLVRRLLPGLVAARGASSTSPATGARKWSTAARRRCTPRRAARSTRSPRRWPASWGLPGCGSTPSCRGRSAPRRSNGASSAR